MSDAMSDDLKRRLDRMRRQMHDLLDEIYEIAITKAAEPPPPPPPPPLLPTPPQGPLAAAGSESVPLDQMLLTTVEVAVLLHCHRTTVYQRIEKGTLPSVRVGDVVRVPTIELSEKLGLPLDVVVAAITTYRDGDG